MVAQFALRIFTDDMIILTYLDSTFPTFSILKCPSGHLRCASDCVAECRVCNREVAGSNLGLGHFAPRSTQPSTSSGSVNEYQLQLGRQRQVPLIPLADETQGMQVKPQHT